MLTTCCTDQALHTVAVLSEELQLPCYIGADVGRKMTNKRYMKQVFAQNGIPTAPFCVVNRPDEVEEKEIPFPAVVKPVDCNSSKGVTKVENKQDLMLALQYALEISRSGDAIIESYIDGKELSVEVYLHQGQAELLCVSESQKIKSDDKFIIVRGLYPPNVDEKTMAALQEVAQRVATAFRLKSGPLMLQVLCTDARVFVVECSARTGGGMKFQMVERASGINPIGKMLEASLGESTAAQCRPSDSLLLSEYLYCKAGVFHHVEGLEGLKQQGIISDFFVFKTAGTVMTGTSSSGDRIAGVFFEAKTQQQLQKNYRLDMQSIRVIDQNGQDILRHDLNRLY